MKSVAVMLILGVVIGATVLSYAVYQLSLDTIPLLPIGPFHFLIASESAGLYVFDGNNLSPVDLAPVNLTSSNHLIGAGWRHDGSYALIGGTHGILLKYDGRSVERIQTGLNSSTVLYAVSWNSDDSQALIAGSKGIFLVFNGTSVEPIATNISETMLAVKWR